MLINKLKGWAVAAWRQATRQVPPIDPTAGDTVTHTPAWRREALKARVARDIIEARAAAARPLTYDELKRLYAAADARAADLAIDWTEEAE